MDAVNENAVEGVKKEFKGADLEDAKFEFEGGYAVVSGKLSHVGKMGEIELSLKAKVDAKPIVNKAIDAIEKAIPGDQTGLAEKLKAAVALAFGVAEL